MSYIFSGNISVTVDPEYDMSSSKQVVNYPKACILKVSKLVAAEIDNFLKNLNYPNILLKSDISPKTFPQCFKLLL